MAAIWYQVPGQLSRTQEICAEHSLLAHRTRLREAPAAPTRAQTVPATRAGAPTTPRPLHHTVGLADRRRSVAPSHQAAVRAGGRDRSAVHYRACLRKCGHLQGSPTHARARARARTHAHVLLTLQHHCPPSTLCTPLRLHQRPRRQAYLTRMSPPAEKTANLGLAAAGGAPHTRTHCHSNATCGVFSWHG